MTRISLFVHDLSSNPIVRAAPIGKALQLAGFDVEVLGLLVENDEVYAPYRDTFDYHVLPSSLRPVEVLSKARNLADRATGDVQYAFKPFWTTFYPALLASGFGARSPLILDVEDEPFLYRKGSLLLTVGAEAVLGWAEMVGTKYNVLLHPLTKRAHAVSVVSRKLQSRYGGELLLHGPSKRGSVPDRPVFGADSGGARRRFDLPDDAPLIGFAGVPRPHKGLDLVVRALEQPKLAQYHLVLAGPPSHPAFVEAKSRLGARCHVVGLLNQEEMPEFLSAVDVVPVVQRRNRVTEAQVPAKVLEAMAAGRVIVGSRVGDLPCLLRREDGDRGWLVEPGAIGELTDVLRNILDDREASRGRADRAREFFEREASVEANANKVKHLVARAAARFGTG